MSDYKPYTDDPEEFDFERAKLLLDIIVSAGQHGPMFQKIVAMAQDALKEMIQPPEPKTVMPPQGGEEQLNLENPESAALAEEKATAEREKAQQEAARRAEDEEKLRRAAQADRADALKNKEKEDVQRRV